MLIIGWLYFTFLESSKSRATPGKMAAEIFVTDSQNQKISFKKANKRSLIKIFPLVIILFLFIIDFPVFLKIIVFLLSLSLFFPFGPAKQTISDRIADTFVLKKEEPVSLGKQLPLTMVGQIEEIMPKLPEKVSVQEIKPEETPFLERETPHYNILEKLKNTEGKDFITYARAVGNEWLCVCGTLNRAVNKCILCKRLKDHVLDKYTKEKILRDTSTETEVKQEEPIVEQKDSYPPADVKKETLTGGEKPMEAAEIPLAKETSKITETTKEEKTEPEEEQEKKEISLEKLAPSQEMLNLLKKIEGDDFINYAREEEEKWLCVCGNINSVSFEECINCQRKKSDVLAKYTKEKLEDQG